MLTIRIYMKYLYKQNLINIYIVFKRCIYNYVHFRLRYLDTVFQNEQQRRRFLVIFFQNKVRLQGIMADSFWHILTFYIIKMVFQ